MKFLSLARTLTALSALVPLLTSAQGTMVYDQQSSDESNPGSGAIFIQRAQPTGQSFTPSLNAIGFVRLSLFDHVRDNGVGATIYVNLRSDSITGPIMDSTAPVALPDNFGPFAYVDFYFPSNVPLQVGTKYYLEPVVQSGDEWGVIGDLFNYSGGEAYTLGVATSSDYWFREGIIVPEPSSFALLALAGGALLLFRRSKCL